MENNNKKSMEPPKKPKPIPMEPELGWPSRVSIADNWKGSLKRATLAKEDDNYFLYYRIVDALIDSLFEKEQTQIENLIASELKEEWNKFDQYRVKERIIVKVLDKADFLRIWYEPQKKDGKNQGAEFGRSKPGFVTQGGKDDTTKD